MTFNPGLSIGDVISNEKIRDIFKCWNMGGMRKSNTTGTLVIVSDHTKALYEDRWEKEILHYTGMGKNGDQDINFLQNKTLNESSNNGVDVFLFEVVKEKEYIYMGQVERKGDPYQEEQPGEDGVLRKVWIFPVILKGKYKAALVSENLAKINNTKKQKKARRLSTNEVRIKAQQTGKQNVGCRNSMIKVYERNPYVVEVAKESLGTVGRHDGATAMSESDIAVSYAI